MNLKLFRLIHWERPYKRYYYQPLKRRFIGSGLLKELRSYAGIIVRSIYLPFNSKYNTQQFEGKRKSKALMLYESIIWAFKYKEVCKYYFLYGLDLKGRNPKDYVAYTEFRVLRNILNFRIRENINTLYTFNYLALARDKFIFYQYCKSLEMPYPKTIALVSKGKICWYENGKMEFQAFETLKQKTFKAFCKEVNGESGKGAFNLDVIDGKFYFQEKKISFLEVKELFGFETYIIQERLKNHPIIDSVYPRSLNTIKLITFLNEDGSVDFFDAVLRFGANGSFVDNASQGGIFVGISEDGYLQPIGYHEPGIKKKLVIKGVHPDTGIAFGGIKLPYWEELLNTSKEYHKFFYGIPSIGWDIAITPNGFVFTETGEDWEIPVYQVTNGPKREPFYKTHGKALKIKLRKY